MALQKRCSDLIQEFVGDVVLFKGFWCEKDPNGPNEPMFMHGAGTSTEACYQKIDPRVAGSLICLHQPETDGNVEIVGRGGRRANPLEFGSDPHHPGGFDLRAA